MSPVATPVPNEPVLLSQLGGDAGAVLRATNARLQVIDDADALAWERAGEVDLLLTAPRNGWRHAPKAAPAGWPGRIRWVHTASAGVDYFPSWLFDVPRVTCGRGVAAEPIAEFVLAALLEQGKSLADRRVVDVASWRSGFERANAVPMGLLSGQTLGLVGYGAIGQAVARRALAFGMRVQALRRTAAPLPDAEVHPVATLAELLASSDHLVLALPHTPQTHHLINDAVLAHARPGLHLVNIARGQLVDQVALLRALDDGRLAAATLDVTDPEPLPDGHPLYTHPRVRLTPHISWAAGDVHGPTLRKFQDNLRRYLDGVPLLDVVDPAQRY